MLVIVTPTLSLGLMAAGLALPQAFFRWYLREAADDRERAHIVTATLGLRVAASSVALVVALVAVVPLVGLLYGFGRADSGAPNGWVVLPAFLLIAPVLFLDSVSTIPLSFLRATRRARSYAVVSFIRVLGATTVVVVLVVLLRWGVAGVVMGSAIGAALSLAAGAGYLRRQGLFRFSWDRPLARRMLAFSLPLVPAAIAGWTLNLSDRYLLQLFAPPIAGGSGSAVVGIYALGYTLGLIINALAIQPFTLAWGAAYWEISRRPTAKAEFARVLTAFVAVAGLVATALGTLGTDAVRIFAGPGFELSRYVVPFSAFAYVCYGIYTIVTTGLNLESQTRKVPLVIGAAAIGNVALNLLLIPTLGLFGAALSTLLSYGALAILAGLVSQRAYPVAWDVARVMANLFVGLGLSAAALLGPDTLWWRLLCLAGYVPILLGLRVITLAELGRVTSLLRRR